MGRLLRFCRNAALFLLSLVLLAAAARFILFRGPSLPPQPLPRAGIIDLHCHTAGIGAGNSGCFVSEELRASAKLPIYLRAFGVTQEELEQQGDALVIRRLARRIAESRFVDRAVVLALDGVVADGELDRERTQVYVPNEFVAREVEGEKTLLFGASINPHRKDALARLDRVLEEGAVLLKWIPSIMDIDPADEAITPFYRRMQRAGLPLLTHTGRERSFLGAVDELCDPIRLELPLRLGVTVIAAHVATTGESEGQDNFERILPLFEKYDNLYADISSLTQINKLGYLDRTLRDERARERLVYGSDFPLQFFPVVSPFYQALHLRIGEMVEVARIANPWDRDAVLKQKMGVPAAAFLRGASLLRLPPATDEADGEATPH